MVKPDDAVTPEQLDEWVSNGYPYLLPQDLAEYDRDSFFVWLLDGMMLFVTFVYHTPAQERDEAPARFYQIFRGAVERQLSSILASHPVSWMPELPNQGNK